MELAPDGQVHDGFGGGVEQFEHQHGRHGEHQHRKPIQAEAQPETEQEHQGSGDHVDAEIALTGEAVGKPLGGVAETGG